MSETQPTITPSPAAPSFSATPLITPRHLEHVLEAVRMFPTPAWVNEWLPIGPTTTGLADSREHIVVGEAGEERGFIIPTVSLALLFELTRYGNTIVVTPEGRLRIVYADIPATHADVEQLVIAPPSRAVGGPDGNLRPEDFEVGASQVMPSAAARSVAIHHCVECADLTPGADVVVYVENLLALFDLHDRLFNLPAEECSPRPLA